MVDTGEVNLKTQQTQLNAQTVQKHVEPVIYQTVYNTEKLQTVTCTITEFEPPSVPENEVLWLHCVGINSESDLNKVLAPYPVHALVVEDILSLKQRPKIENYGQYIFYVARILYFRGKHLRAEQVSMIIGENFFISFQASDHGDLLSIRKSIEENINEIRNKRSDFLAYVFIDQIIDSYYIMLEEFTERIDKVERNMLEPHKGDRFQQIHRYKRDSIAFRGALLPMQESLSMILVGKAGSLFEEGTKLFMRDVMDHVNHLLYMLDTTRELITGIMEIHLTLQSNRLNEQMRLLTAITIIFMPLTLIAGIYGMNFDHMPELRWEHGYFVIISVMLVIALSLVIFFKKCKWF